MHLLILFLQAVCHLVLFLLILILNCKRPNYTLSTALCCSLKIIMRNHQSKMRWQVSTLPHKKTSQQSNFKSIIVLIFFIALHFSMLCFKQIFLSVFLCFRRKPTLFCGSSECKPAESFFLFSPSSSLHPLTVCLCL